MAVGKTASIFNADGSHAVLSCGNWFCYQCSKLRKTIYYPFTGTIDEPCSCGCTIVYKME